MKKVINGKKYDTDTAYEVGSYYQGNYGDFFSFCEILYRKKTKEFFLECSGGPMSKYSEYFDGDMCGTHILKPLTDTEAKIWAEKYCEVDVYEQLFGEVEE